MDDQTLDLADAPPSRPLCDYGSFSCYEPDCYDGDEEE